MEKKDQRFDEQKTEPSEFCYRCQSDDWTIKEPALQTVLCAKFKTDLYIISYQKQYL